MQPFEPPVGVNVAASHACDQRWHWLQADASYPLSDESPAVRIALKFDSDLLHRYASEGRSLAFGISLEHGGASYPDDEWVDFGLLLLAWWCAAIIRLAEGAVEERLQFMEGPYAARVRLDRASGLAILSLERRPEAWHIPLTALAKALVDAAETVQAELADTGLPTTDSESLVALARTAHRAASRAAP